MIFADWIKKRTNGKLGMFMGMTYEDETWTDYGAYKLAEDAFKAGYEAAIKETSHSTVYETGFNNGKDDGYNKGHQRGWDEGIRSYL